MLNDLTLQLTAQRHALGLNVSELAELPAIAQDKRVISDYERGRRIPAQSYVGAMSLISMHYDLLLKLILRDIDAHHFRYPLPKTDDAAEYFKRLESVNHLALPYFADFERFKSTTGNTNKGYWRIWQSVIGHLSLVGKILRINDDVLLPDSFTNSKDWLALKYEVTEEED